MSGYVRLGYVRLRWVGLGLNRFTSVDGRGDPAGTAVALDVPDDRGLTRDRGSCCPRSVEASEKNRKKYFIKCRVR
jgi:hypothetical protein